MCGGLTEIVRVAVQWIFAPLLVVAVLAWLYLRVKASGSFVYRYPDHATAYPPVLPFDYDGDGLENSVDPDSEVPSPDAYGTNAQWYNTVYSNLLVAAEYAVTSSVPFTVSPAYDTIGRRTHVGDC